MHVLIANHEMKVVSFLRRKLEENGFIIDAVSNGKDAVLKAKNYPYDVILMDIVLPQKDGLTAIMELRSKNIMTPILCLTEKADLNDIVAGLDAGSDSYMTIPFALTELKARMRAIVRRTRLTSDTAVCFADLRLDLMSRKLWRSNKEVHLSGKEYSLLEYFMRHPNQILSRTMIDEHVWGFIDYFSNRVDTYVFRLRRKIDINSENKFFHTVRGGGYVLRLGK